MTPGTIPDEAGQTARSLITVLKDQPVILGLLLVVIALLVFMFYALHSAAKFRETLVSQVFANTQAIHTMLSSRAVVCPPPGQEYKLQSEESHPVELPSEKPLEKNE